MKEEYIVTNEYLAQRGVDLNNYALDGTYINAIINLALDLVVTRICFLNDSIKGEEDIEKYLDENSQKVNAFFKLQYRMVYNLIFQAETSPVDQFVDNIIVFELGLGKINGFQKGLFYKNN